MARVNSAKLAEELEQLVRLSASELADRPSEEEAVGTSADELVTATVIDGRVQIDIHALAKRRLDREELASAVAEAVTNAESQPSTTATSLLDNLDLTGTGVSEETRDRVSSNVRAHLARLPFRL